MTSSEPAPGRRRRRDADDDPFDPAGRPEDVLLTSAQVAQLLHVVPKTVIHLVNTGILQAHRIPGTRQYLFFRQAVMDLIAESAIEPGEADPDEVGPITAERQS